MLKYIPPSSVAALNSLLFSSRFLFSQSWLDFFLRGGAFSMFSMCSMFSRLGVEHFRFFHFVGLIFHDVAVQFPRFPTAMLRFLFLVRVQKHG